MASIKRDNGQNIVEFAITFPLLALLLFGIIEFSLVVLAYDTIANAAREGARTAIRASASNQEVIDATLGMTTGVNITADNISISHPTAHNVRVAITYDHGLITSPIIRALGGVSTITLHTSSTMMVE